MGISGAPTGATQEVWAPRSVCVCDNVTRMRTGFGSHTCSHTACSAKCVNTLGTFPHPRFEKHLQASGLSHTQRHRSVVLYHCLTHNSAFTCLCTEDPRPRGFRHVNSPHIAQPHPESHTNTVIRPHTSSRGDTAARTPSHTQEAHQSSTRRLTTAASHKQLLP